MGNSLDYIKYRVLEQKDTNLDIAFDRESARKIRAAYEADERWNAMSEEEQ